MKLNAIIGILGIVVFVSVGIPQVKQFQEQRDSMTVLKGNVETGVATYHDLQSQLEVATNQLLAEGKDICLDNVGVAQLISQFAGADLTNIVAVGESEGVVGDVFMTTNPEDLVSLESNVSQMRFDFTLTDAEAFMQSVEQSNLVFDSITVDNDTKQAQLVIPVVTGNYQVNTGASNGYDLTPAMGDAAVDAVDGTVESMEESTEDVPVAE